MFGKKFWILVLSLLLLSFLFVSCRPPTEPEGIASISVDKMVKVEGGDTYEEEIEQCVCQNVVFQFIVSNDGEETLYNISVSDLIPSGLEYIPGSGSGVTSPSGTPSNPVWNFPGPLVPNSSIHMKFAAHVVTEGEHENCVKVQAETDDGVVVNDEDCTVVEGTICELEHKMHYPQYPDVDGWDVYSCKSVSLDEMIQVADDWKCSETGLVENIRFWGSWKDDNVGQISGFNVEVYSNSLAGGYSHPDVLLWESFVTDYTSQEIQTPVPEGWYNPFMDSHEDYNHNAHYRYDITDIEEPFYQEEGIIYWLSVWPVIDGNEVWGWKSSEDHWMDDACWSVHLPQTPAVDWQELYEPTAVVQSLDLAFIIYGGDVSVIDEEPPCVEHSVTLTVGICDNFNLPTEATSPSQALLDWIAAHYAYGDTRDCDEDVIDRYWAHTFTGLEPSDGCHIVSATLEITVKNKGFSLNNDHLKIGCISDSNDSWEVNNELTYFGIVLGSEETIILDLSDVHDDGTTNLLGIIESEGFLDIAVDDDSPVDCAILHVTYGP